MKGRIPDIFAPRGHPSKVHIENEHLMLIVFWSDPDGVAFLLRLIFKMHVN
jgi:hypothetical protein